ncbi:uncharacterized protein BO80DRAFT_493826 [Aspergillus ibericus CBS 121593]|uniref:Glycoside hydrolase n=1 Tax=Aspergillus ibericus CBS 121593 TaxID=1448316 RepID=A0A395H153_9EURO|nr:hypothetical protein BO80DRAFT_493826 [Aspergillus ibericus CBS 121593]RAL00955.1 hypothetical protein BO80DRAFT_493826 [Aspergillus ibericus CBS 121593]
MSELYCPLPPRDQDIFRFRSQYGASLGSVFVLGPRLNNHTPREDPDGSSELQSLKKSIASNGLDETRRAWETHWLSALSHDDLRWLKDVAQCRTLRIPLSFYSLGPLFCLGTPFEGEPSKVYHSCWNIVKHLIEKCRFHGIGVLIDFHTSSSGINLCASEKDRAVARDCVAFLAQEVTFHGMSGVVGLSISSGCENASDMCECYGEVLKIGRAIDPCLPIYIDDGQEQSKKQVFAGCKSDIPQFKTDFLNGTVQVPSCLTMPQAEVREKTQQAKANQSQFLEKALSQISSSWSSHKRQSFAHGWDLGYNDALQFFGAAVQGVLPPRDGADKISALELWIRQRKRDIDPEQLDEDPTAWEEGLRKGIDDLSDFVGI